MLKYTCRTPLDPYIGSKPRDPDQSLERNRVKTTLKNQNETTRPLS